MDSKKAQALKAARNIAISIAVLLVLIIGAGVAYTWYIGQNAEQNSTAIAAPVEEVPIRNTLKEPPKVDPKAPVGLSVQTITSPILPGSNASIIVKTNPAANCKITVEYNKIPSKDSGLVPKAADEYGLVEWTWTVESTVPLGTWPVDITCANAKNSGMVRGDLKVVSTLEE